MALILVCLTALAVSALSLFSGFGLGTLLMPAFALFFSARTAVAATAMVHLANNVFKVLLVGRHADVRITLRFALPAALSALAGALLLDRLSGLAPLLIYAVAGKACAVEPVKLVLAMLIVAFGAAELSGGRSRFSLPPAFIPLGGLLSGFLGGLSGHQGALRTVFLARAGLSKEALVGTMAAASLAVDAVRLAVYGATFLGSDLEPGVWPLVLTGCLAAFAGAFLGKKWLGKTTLGQVHRLAGWCLAALGLALGLGLV
jgi:uncharacterized membrane protein YfcA